MFFGFWWLELDLGIKILFFRGRVEVTSLFGSWRRTS